jgi:hypothetical protein
VRGATWLVLLALVLGCGVYGEPLRQTEAAGASAGEPCAAGETCPSEENR